MVFGLGGTQNLSLPMMTVLRRFSILMTMIGNLIILIASTLSLEITFPGEFCILHVNPSTSVKMSVFMMILGSVVAAYNDLAFNLRG